MDHLMSTPLRWHCDAADLFHLRIVRWAHTKQVASNLTTSNDRRASLTQLYLLVASDY